MTDETSKSERPPERATPWELQKRLTYAVLGTFSLSDDVPEQIPANRVYTAFYELKPKYPRWLGSLYFQTSKHATVCKGLEDILFYLGAFGLVTVENRDFRCLRFSSKDKAVTRNKIRKQMIKGYNLKELEGLSNDFAKLVKEKAEEPNTCTR